MVIVKENKKGVQNEKLTNLMKTVQTAVSLKTNDAIHAYVDNNSNMQPFVDSGGKTAMVLAYTIGAVDGIRSYIEHDVNQNDSVIFQGVIHKLMDLRHEAMSRLKNSV